jgi:hypothetical protein
LPSITSAPPSPLSFSAPAPPRIASLPPWPSMRVGIAVVKAPPESSMRIWSLPRPASTRMRLTRSRAIRKSALPLSPKSISSLSGAPALRRSAILSFAPVPLDDQGLALEPDSGRRVGLRRGQS